MTFHDICVGIGQHCESTHQIRRISGTTRANFFDWLGIYDLAVVRNIIESDFPVSLNAGRMALREDGRGAIDLDTGISYMHDFVAPPGAELRLSDIEEQLPKVRSKFCALAQRWREMSASPQRVLYVRQDATGAESAADIGQLRDTIADRYPAHQFSILWLGRSVPDDVDRLPPGIAFREVGLKPGRWEGDDAAWDELFNTLPEDALWPSSVASAC